MNDLQALVDALASDLERPVGIDDRRFRSLAYSSHIDQLDQVRLSSILQREAPQPVVAYLASLGIEDADTFRRIPANPGLGMVARVCLPLRFGETLLGYLWLFDEPAPITDAEIGLACQCAEEVSALLFRQRRIEIADRSEERELLGRVVGLRPGDREQASEALTSGGWLAASAWRYVLVLQAISAAGGAVDDQVRVRLAAAADRLRRSVVPHHVLVLSAGDAVVMLVAVDEDTGMERKLRLVVESAEQLLHDVAHWSPVVGVSAKFTSLMGAERAFVEARGALSVAAVDPSLRPVARWDDLGARRTIVRMLGGEDPAGVVPPSVRALLDAPDAGSLVQTLLTWLDNGGDAKLTAEQLFVHRSSLYNRLHRVESLCGVSLRSGDARLELHLGLRLWQLAGGSFGRASDGPKG